MSAWYLSELVMKLTLRLDPQPEIFGHYEQALLDLREAPSHERSLRVFEKRLLDVLGYGIPREQEAEAADPLGLARLPAGLLRRLAEEDLDDPQSLEQVRPVLRRALALCLEGRDLRTRSVAQSLLEMKRANLMTIALGVNVDHVATVRQARRARHPDPVHAALVAEQAGADSITMHLREDRRHIIDRDPFALQEMMHTHLNLEMAVTPEMLAIACRLKPSDCCLVPEKRTEVTTEGGLDVSAQIRCAAAMPLPS